MFIFRFLIGFASASAIYHHNLSGFITIVMVLILGEYIEYKINKRNDKK